MGEGAETLVQIETWWWLLFCTVFGLCVGSFLNVVIYRVPHGLSLGQPLWSFCPACGSQIRWSDNIPLLSYLRLWGRCRDCDAPIPVRYPLIEVTMALVVLVLVDAFFVAQSRGGLNRGAIGLTWRIAEDWPMLLAHVVLFASLLATSAIDIEHYWIDTGIARLAVVAGFVLHGLWTPRHSLPAPGWTEGWVRPWESTAVACGGALVGLLVTSLIAQRMARPEEPFVELDPEPEGADPLTGGESLPQCGDVGRPVNPEPIEPAGTEDRGEPWSPRCGLAIGAVCGAALALWIVVVGAAGLDAGLAVPAWIRLGALPAALLALTVGLSTVRRPADRQILEDIEAERPAARQMAVRELLLLTPSIGLAAASLALFRRSDGWAGCAHGVLHWQPVGDWQPVWGLATAASGYVIAAAIGWAVRIGATLAYGREAFGDGDIHVMAAAGCVTGWPVVLLGFVLTCVLALTGWVLALPFKRTRAIPLVPWLSLSFLITVLFYDRLLDTQPVRNVIWLAERLVLGNSQGLLDGGP